MRLPHHGAWLLVAALACRPAAAASRAEDAIGLIRDGPAAQLRDYWPAGGPLDRYEGRPGAWYALLYVPGAPGLPLQLAFPNLDRRRDVRLLALDLPPAEYPTVVHDLHLVLQRGHGWHRAQWVSRFVLPAASTTAGFFVLVESWQPDGRRPPPQWVHLATQPHPPERQRAWWDPAPAPIDPPPSPLSVLSPQEDYGDLLPF